MGLTPYVSVRKILISMCNIKILVVKRDKVNGDRTTLRLVGHKRHLIASSIIRVHGIDSRALINSTPSVAERFVRLHNVKVISMGSVFNMRDMERARGVSLIVALRS